VIVDCAHYPEGLRQYEGSLSIDGAASAANGEGSFVWLGLYEPSDEEMGKVAQALAS
jgi:magnesium transporter